MNLIITKENYTEPPLSLKTALRYAGGNEESAETVGLAEQCFREVYPTLSYKVCHTTLDVSIKDNICDFGVFRIESKYLAKNLNGCNQAILFAATIGVGYDRMISKYSRTSPAKALMIQAIGAERVEALCNTFCADMEKRYEAKLRPRFSPGFGDLYLDIQKEIFSILDCPRQIGVSLNDSLLMSPSKSVTAFVGITDRGAI